MKVAIIGYGKMGKEVEKIALSLGHEIIIILDDQPLNDQNVEILAKADLAIEFTCPEAAVNNYYLCFDLGLAVVSGTTGWLDKFEEVKRKCVEEGHSFFYSSNFSLGVNIFYELNKKLARIMSNYENYNVSIKEVHHKEKIDKPSGTAITLADDISANNMNKEKWILGKSDRKDEISITAVREENITGSHFVKYDSDIDSIEISHIAKNRKGFAAGVIIAAEFLAGKTGFYGMEDLLGSGD
ncbi:4-hydroxy-tetrahydrodipicolinate reductase [Bacteroidota bacterium]